jgi:hypothetical protein
VFVMLKNNSQQLVPSKDLEPFIPEEGDHAKCLQWGQREDVAQVTNFGRKYIPPFCFCA